MTTTTDSTDKRKSIATNVAKGAVSIATTVVLMWWLLHKVDLHHVMAIVREGVDYRFLIAMMALTVLSHMIRGIRWGIQLRALGVPRIPVMAESVSIFGAYALNLLFPFLGEAWRCLYISRRENWKLSAIVGTDLGDRASDGIVIASLIALTMVVAHPAMMHFLDRYSFGRMIDEVLDSHALWIGAVAFMTLLVAVDYKFRTTPFVAGINASLLRIWRGFAVLFHISHPWEYIILTLGIWVCYFLETYLCFFAFPFTRELITAQGTCMGLIPGLVVFVFGSCSMIVPSNGGLGPWNIAVMFALSLYGISMTDGTAFSLVFWTFQTVVQIASGVFSAIYIAFDRRHSANSSATASVEHQ